MNNIHFDFKISVWERVFVPEQYEQEILEKIRSGEIRTSNDIFAITEKALIDRLHDTEATLCPEENFGYATIEVGDFDNNILYKNGY